MTAPAVTLTTERKQFLFDVFCAALEGGIGYWSLCHKYCWRKFEAPQDAPFTDTTDLDGFHAIIEEQENGDWSREGEKPRVRVDAEAIERGIAKLAAGEVKIGSVVLGRILAGSALNDAGDIDSEAADCIVQAAVLDEVKYG